VLRPVEQVLAVAVQAGFSRAKAADAAALALVATNADDTFDWHPSPGLWRRGLWALDVHAFAPDDPDVLFGPATSARLLHEAWSAAGRSFTWHPDWDRADRRAWSRALRDPAVRPDPAPPAPDVLGAAAWVDLARRVRTAVAEGTATVAAVRRWGGSIT
jgi:hypothetical protein